ncbi:hypothetical protein EJB05_43070, partial [Eragrostis curvula]
ASQQPEPTRHWPATISDPQVSLRRPLDFPPGHHARGPQDEGHPELSLLSPAAAPPLLFSARRPAEPNRWSPPSDADAGDRLRDLRGLVRLPFLLPPPRLRSPSRFRGLPEAPGPSHAGAEVPAISSHGLRRRLARELLQLRQAHGARLAHLPATTANFLFILSICWPCGVQVGIVNCADCKGTGFRAKWLEEPPVN